MVGYPNETDELEVIRRTTGSAKAKADAVLSGETLLALQTLVRDTPIAEGILRYALALVRATRPVKEGGLADIAQLLQWGGGPRAGQSLVLCAKARATLQGRAFVTIDDIKAMAKPVMRHRLHASYEAEAQGMTADSIIDRIIGLVKLPTSDLEKDPMVAKALSSNA